MLFQISDFLEAKLASVTPRSEIHGDDEKPAVSFALSITTSGDILDTIDADLRRSAFKHSKTKALPGVPDVPTVLACNSVDYIALDKKYEGWTLEVDDGVDESKPMTFGGCKLDGFKVEPLQGGSVTLRMRVGTSDIDAQRSGMLSMHVGQSIWIKATPPKPGDGKPTPNGNGKAIGPDATDMFLEQHGEKAAAPASSSKAKPKAPTKAKTPAKKTAKASKPGKR